MRDLFAGPLENRLVNEAHLLEVGQNVCVLGARQLGQEMVFAGRTCVDGSQHW